ncbi:capsid cement protein [Celerinatantimonas sp. MCCC 1A17872]|uniref:capsid cement protein n=1 Tax=Celerinatantimonas sp. MCCC 1A17872 TaxID=3177514 RepID=UPI0038C5A500
MKIAPGLSIDCTAPAAGFKKDQPTLHGSMVIVPNMNASEGAVVSCTWYGLYDGPIKAGDSPSFMGEPAYFDGTNFTKTQPDADTAGNITTAVGAFIDNGVLLMGVPVVPVADAAESGS